MNTPDSSKRKSSVIFTKYEHEICNDDDDDDDGGHEPQQQSVGHQPAQTSTMLDLSIIQDTSTA
jgi:hypothetical protein